MLIIKQAPDIRPSEVTPKHVYINRRKFMMGAGIASTAVLAGRFAGRMFQPGLSALADQKLQYVKSDLSTQGEQLTPFKDITSYNNFYEFGTDKGDPAAYAKNFRTSPWTVSIEGEVKQPRVYDFDSILKMHPSLEERVYRLRCVEAWSMVIPWIGIPLNSVIKTVEPTSKAKYIAFETLHDPKQMPGQKRPVLKWPYVEGLRMDEAMHPLTILAVGLYGEVLPNQDGAPLRLVVPWKYGFKSIKSIVRIKFVEKQPPTTWNWMAPDEYGFYSNVNPTVDHPRWSQAKERRIGEFFKRNTLMFNGYGDQVASLYAGMNLRKYY
ncbi:MAG TPA: protein-methionine-sulfoxide reductase catalytic subunit MsrP [Acidobacteriota bacterium]|nr:protein-methionine-sulfoxide reductase catalytic subunit MsrP [Acidobacteriota bacterium]